jgi:glycosyltransferase involved in cell wall biosynthesis
MKIAIVAPSPVPFTVGGAEKLCWGLLREVNENTNDQAELIRLPAPENSFWDLVDSYQSFSRLDLSHFDQVISTKYPSWMVSHPNHVCYMLHRLRGFYDCFHFLNLPGRYESLHPEVQALQRLLNTRAPDQQSLAEVFDCLQTLRHNCDDIPSDAFQFPGSLIKELVHYFDRVGLRCKAIQRYYAISRTVAQRHLYFPDGASVQVLHPPSNLEGFYCGEFKYLFTASRLDAPKRIGLLIEAMRYVRSDIELRIAGEGPEESHLRKMAESDQRVVFLGYRSDAELVEDYANALAVAFVPYDEDYGFITIEAMMSGKAVLTVTDAGGPTEFVRHKQTGLCVATDPKQIAEGIDWLVQHKDAAVAMGREARLDVESITWPQTLTSLLHGKSNQARQHSRKHAPRKLTVASTFPIIPVRAGGQARIFNLYKTLAPSIETELVTLGYENNPRFDCQIAPGLTEIRIPMSKAHAEAEAAISAEVDWFPVTDVVFPQLIPLTPAYLEALDRSCRKADVVVASHPYVLSALESVTDKPLWYEAHNVEHMLKRDVIPRTAMGRKLMEEVMAIERRCCEKALIVMSCSKTDGEELSRSYGIPASKLRIVPNGVDASQIRFVSRDESAQVKLELGLAGMFFAVFVGSWHQPNLRAVSEIMVMARATPGVHFLIVGGSGSGFDNRSKPENVALLNPADEVTKSLVLVIADVALNPMLSGSGTNLKMLEYAASGIPIITTALGTRGLAFQHELDIFVEEISSFGERIESIRQTPAKRMQDMAWRARQRVESQFDWRNISQRFLESL